MKKCIWLWTFVLCGWLCLGLQTEAANTDVIHEGVHLDEVDVSGMTKEEATQALNQYVESLGEKVLTLQVEEHQVEVSLSELGLTWSDPQVVDEALGVCRSGDIIKRFKEKKQIEEKGKQIPMTWSLDENLVSQVIEERCVVFDVAAVDARLIRENGVFTVVPGVTGVKLDPEGSKQAILTFVEQDLHKENSTIALPAQVDVPRGNAEELSKVTDVLGTFSTKYATSSSDRAKNVDNGAALVNGTVLYPGDTFSFTEAVVPFTIENGYAPAGSYLNGKVVDSLGGGICQVSTTFYNAVLRAELEVVERHNHSMIVTYVDPAADAAIAEGLKDFVIRNNTDSPVYIEGTTANRVVTFTIYGQETRPANREVKYTSVTLSTTDPGWQIIADPGQGIGYYLTESAHVGRVAELYKHVYEDGVEVSKELVNKSTYKASPRTITVGVAGDPALSAELQAAIATQDEGLVQAVLGSCLARMQ